MLSMNEKREFLNILNNYKVNYKLFIFGGLFKCISLVIFSLFAFLVVKEAAGVFVGSFSLLFIVYHIFVLLKTIKKFQNIKEKIKSIESNNYNAIDVLIDKMKLERVAGRSGNTTHFTKTKFYQIKTFIKNVNSETRSNYCNLEYNLHSIENKQQLYLKIINSETSRMCKLIFFNQYEPGILVHFSDNY